MRSQDRRAALALEHKQRLRRTIAYIDPIDFAYNRFERVPKPTTQAVMFCLMDASASMTEPLKDLAKRFFMLLHVFLMRYYREVHIVFIRHTSTAAEVDEETFFRGTETGGTVISTALDEMLKIVRERYSPADWNIYAAQASDGDNFHDDMPRCLELLERGDPAGVPVFRLYRDHARRALQRHGGDARLARLHRGRAAAPQLRHASGGVAGGHLPGVPRTVFGGAASPPEGDDSRWPPCEQEASQAQRQHAPPVRRGGVELRADQQGLRRDGRDRAGRDRARHLSQPDRGHHRRADARLLLLDRHAGDVPALVVRQALRPRRGLLQARHAQPRLRARHQFRSLHQLHHGGELHDHAGAGAGARRLRPQPFLQEQLPVPALDPARPHHRLPGLRQDLRGRVRGAARPGGGRKRARCRARADEPGRQPRPAPAPAQRRQARAGAARRAAGRTRRRPTTTSTARCPRSRRSARATRPRRRASSAGSACPRRTCSISWRRMRPSSRTGSASCYASCACCRSTSIRSARPR